MYSQFRPGNLSAGRYWYEISLETPNMELVLLATFMLALAEFEGFFIPNSIAQRHNNPGNLRPIGASQGFRTFPTPEDGWEALKHQVVLNIGKGLTLDQFFLGKPGVYPGYTPLGDNPADVMENYLSFMARRTSMSRNLDLGFYFPSLAKVGLENIPVQGIIYGYQPQWEG